MHVSVARTSKTIMSLGAGLPAVAAAKHIMPQWHASLKLDLGARDLSFRSMPLGFPSH